MDTKTFSIDDLCLLTGYQKRTVRYYVQVGLLQKPLGEKRGAYYTPEHLDTLLRIKTLTHAGISLERIREVLDDSPPHVPLKKQAFGSISVKSHICIAPGIEIQISPDEAEVSPEQTREFAKAVLEQWNRIKDKKNEE